MLQQCSAHFCVRLFDGRLKNSLAVSGEEGQYADTDGRYAFDWHLWTLRILVFRPAGDKTVAILAPLPTAAGMRIVLWYIKSSIRIVTPYRAFEPIAIKNPGRVQFFLSSADLKPWQEDL